MGMLMHRTWLEQQEKLKKKAAEAKKPVKEETVTEPVTEETKPKAPAKTASRRKTK